MSGSGHWLRWFAGPPSAWKRITAGLFISSPGEPVGDMGELCGSYVDRQKARQGKGGHPLRGDRDAQRREPQGHVVPARDRHVMLSAAVTVGVVCLIRETYREPLR
jgi:hypothetical protein